MPLDIMVETKIVMVDCHLKRHDYIVGYHLSKKEGKIQESIQSSTTPDLGQENITCKRAKRLVLSQQVTTRLREQKRQPDRHET